MYQIFDYIVEKSQPLYELEPAKIGEVEEAIGKNCASLIEDGSTLATRDWWDTRCSYVIFNR